MSLKRNRVSPCGVAGLQRSVCRFGSVSYPISPCADAIQVVDVKWQQECTDDPFNADGSVNESFRPPGMEEVPTLILTCPMVFKQSTAVSTTTYPPLAPTGEESQGPCEVGLIRRMQKRGSRSNLARVLQMAQTSLRTERARRRRDRGGGGGGSAAIVRDR